MLDSDKLEVSSSKAKNDKLNIMRAVFKFIEKVTNEDTFKEQYARKILKYIFK